VTRALRPVSRAVLVALALATATVVTAQPDRPTQQEIEESLTCQCGCGLTVHSCNHIQCGSGEPIKKEIGERLARGETREQILAAFRQRLGEKVLSSPTLEGFNWLAWVTPFAGLLIAGTVLTVTIRRRTHGICGSLLLRRHIKRRAGRRTGRDQLFAGIFANSPGDSKIEDLQLVVPGLSIPRHHDIFRLQVTMNDAGSVGCRQPIQNIPYDSSRGVEGDILAGLNGSVHPLAQRRQIGASQRPEGRRARQRAVRVH